MTKAFHFLRNDMRAGSGREEPWVIGETRTYEGSIAICVAGYHSAPSWYDALQYAPGTMACIVDVSKPVETDDDKAVSKTRTLVDARDAIKALILWDVDCAERALKRSGWKDERSWNVLDVLRRWTNGEATQEELRAAESAAESAARSARFAARSAESAAWAAEIEWQKRRLNFYMEKMFAGEL